MHMRARPSVGPGRKRILERGVIDGIRASTLGCTSACVSARGGDMAWPLRGDPEFVNRECSKLPRASALKEGRM